jgi:hypothetical protein
MRRHVIESATARHHGSYPSLQRCFKKMSRRWVSIGIDGRPSGKIDSHELGGSPTFAALMASIRTGLRVKAIIPAHHPERQPPHHPNALVDATFYDSSFRSE